MVRFVCNAVQVSYEAVENWEFQMIDGDTQKVMELLSQVIVADGHIYKSEIEALTECASSIGLADTSGKLLTEDFVRGWFESHSAQISSFRADDNSDINLTRLILSLSDWPKKQAVVDGLIAISKSDGLMHTEEKLLISIVRAYWQHDGLDTKDGPAVIKH